MSRFLSASATGRDTPRSAKDMWCNSFTSGGNPETRTHSECTEETELLGCPCGIPTATTVAGRDRGALAAAEVGCRFPLLFDHIRGAPLDSVYRRWASASSSALFKSRLNARSRRGVTQCLDHRCTRPIRTDPPGTPPPTRSRGRSDLKRAEE